MREEQSAAALSSAIVAWHTDAGDEKSRLPSIMQYSWRLAAVMAFAVTQLTALQQWTPIGLKEESGAVRRQKRFCCAQERIACSGPKNAMPDPKLRATGSWYIQEGSRRAHSSSQQVLDFKSPPTSLSTYGRR
jgi:hypothetical protein